MTGIQLTDEDYEVPPLPTEGWHCAIVTEASYKVSNDPNSKAEFVEVNARITSGTFHGAFGRAKFFVKKRDGVINKNAVRAAARLIDACGMKQQIPVINDSIALLKDKPCFARFKTEQDEGYEPRSVVTDFRNLNDPPKKMAENPQPAPEANPQPAAAGEQAPAQGQSSFT